ncbi:MAG: ABC transporter substrate-binding protein [Proteobacteria bacterium]|nr:ABC transporter substrate-binding protein [Pseudomonadota bacterium]
MKPLNERSLIEMNRIRKLICVALIALSGMTLAAEEQAPRAVVERLHETLLEAMTRAEQLGYEGRFNLIRPVIDDSFDFNTIARIVTGRYWKDTDPAQRDSFKNVFRKLSAATYATNFSGFSGERFETILTEKSRRGVIVKTALVKADGEEIPLTYLLRGNDNKWLIVNVIAQGISDLSLKRADYTAVIKKEGFDSLVNRLNDKITAMLRGP